LVLGKHGNEIHELKLRRNKNSHIFILSFHVQIGVFVVSRDDQRQISPCKYLVKGRSAQLIVEPPVLPKDGYVAEPSLLQCTRGRFDPETFICEPGKSWIVGELPWWEEETTGIHI